MLGVGIDWSEEFHLETVVVDKGCLIRWSPPDLGFRHPTSHMAPRALPTGGEFPFH